MLVIAVLGAGAGAQDLLSVGTASTPCNGAALLPDLIADAPAELEIVPDHTGSSRFLLVFATSVYNAGDGPLRLVGYRASRAQTDLSVRQVVTCAHGGNEIINLSGAMRYESEPTHHHWHYLDFERYSLKGLSARTPTRRSRKQGFCLVDDSPVSQRLEGKAPEPRFSEPGNACASGHPEALSAEEGLSVGWADEYAPLKEGQYIDLTHMPGGEYRLLNAVNPQGLLTESRNLNDVAGVTIRLSWPHGPSSTPTFTVLGVCLGHAECGA